jgi:hypothetical protein
VRLIQQWADQYGAPPTALDWDPSRARRVGHAWRARRFEAGGWPTARIVRGGFGTFNAAVEQAGLVPRPAPVRISANLAGPESILEAIREWVRRYGDVPSLADWDPGRARRLKQDWRAARYYDGDWPSMRSVINNFGSLRAAVGAAGLVPRAPSSQRHDRRDERTVNRQALIRHAASGREAGLRDLSACLRRLAAARRAADPVAAHAALLDLASAGTPMKPPSFMVRKGSSVRVRQRASPPNRSPARAARRARSRGGRTPEHRCRAR